MREFKFRAWDKDDNKMLFFPGIFNNRPATEKSTFPQYESILEWHDIEIMQYTGLKDSNGKEIYEGDELTFAVFDYSGLDTQYEGCVVYSGSRFMVWNKPDDEFYRDDGGFDLDYVVDGDDEIEIIGNIYENPELLRES